MSEGNGMRFSFDPISHTYRVGGVVYPSVTEVLAPAETFAGVFENVPIDAFELARDRGTYVHESIALLVRGALDWTSVEPTWEPYVRAAERFLTESGLVVTGSEVPVYSEHLKVAGTIDLLGIWRDRQSLIDFKTSAGVPPTVGPQTAGYFLLHRDLYGGKKARTNRYCVHLTPATYPGYRVIPLEDTRDFSIFLSSLNLYHWGVRHARALAA